MSMSGRDESNDTSLINLPDIISSSPFCTLFLITTKSALNVFEPENGFKFIIADKVPVKLIRSGIDTSYVPSCETVIVPAFWLYCKLSVLAAVVIPVPAGSTVNVSNELVVVFSNDITRFAHTANTDSLQYNQNATGTITVSQEGTYEVSIPDLINFTGTLSAIMNLNPFSGSNTFNADLVVIRNSVQNGDEEIISGRFINEVSFDSSRPDIDIDGNILSGFDIPQIYAATEDYYTSPVTPKIIDCEVGDTIRLVFRLFFTNDNTTPQIQDGLVTLNYGPFSAHSDTSLTVKRV